MTFGSCLKLAGVATAAILLTATQSMAEFPARKVQVYYPWAAGTPTYGVSQLIAEGMAKKLGVSVPVVAEPGAGGVKAFKMFLNQPADGYSVVDGYVAPLVLSPIFGKAKWGCDDFVPLYSATSNAFAIAIRPDETRWTDFKSFVAYLKAHPGKTAYNGNGLSLPHMVAAKVLRQLDIVSRPVPYDDLALGMKDLRNGTLDWLIVNPGVYKANKDHLKILVTLSNLKSVQDAYGGAPRPQDFGIDLGVSGLTPMGWDWWLVKKGTPAPELAALRNAMHDALQDPDIRKRILATGFVPTDYAPDDYSKVCNEVRSQLDSAHGAIAWEKKQLQALNQ